MRTRAVVWLVWSIWTIPLAMIVPTLLFELENVGADPLASNLLGALAFLAYITVGAALLSAFGNLALDYAVYSLLTQPDAVPGAAWLGALGGAARAVGYVMIGTLLLLHFPTGQRPAPRWRLLAGIALALVVLFSLSILLGNNLSAADKRLASVANPLGVLPASTADLLQSVSAALLFACVIGCCASVGVRFRRARGIERQQLKWLIWAGLALAVPVVGVIADVPVLQSTAIWNPCLAAIPVAVGIAILRYRLLDIDLILNRTLVYGSLTALLAGLYSVGVVGTQALVNALTGQAKQESPAVVVVTTLVIAALFQPLRRHLQTFIDRRFYRTKYGAARALSRFAETLRGEVELDQLTQYLRAVVEEAIQPAEVLLWLREPQQRVAVSRDIELTEGSR
ncbi:MAG TPA: hypothetical protein VGP82_16675 [Ktedonobacterales bacterium]|nr:hypothetical protein [Ktedonobacterales bacterium]